MEQIFIMDLKPGKHYAPTPFPSAMVKVLSIDSASVALLRLRPLPSKQLHLKFEDFNTGKNGIGYKGVPFIELLEPPG